MTTPRELSEEEVAQLMETPAPPVPADAATILKRVDARRRLDRVLACGALVVVLAVGVGVMAAPERGPDLTMRGAADVSPDLELRWLVEGTTVERGDRPVGADEQVVFTARTSMPGFLCLDERDDTGAWQRLFPMGEAAWEVPAGESLLRTEEEVLAFRTELGAGTRSYRLSWDAEDAGCAGAGAQAEVDIEWAR